MTLTGNLALGSKQFVIQGAGANGFGHTQTTVLNNATLTTSSDVQVGRANLTIGGNSVVTIGGKLRGSSGTGSADWGVVTIQGNANVTATGGVDDNGAAAWAVNLNGGTLTTSYLKVNDRQTGGSAYLTFNGTRVVANQNQSNFVQIDGNGGSNYGAYIGNGGALIDTDSYAVTISTVLKNASGSTGFLTKYGSGILTLSGANTYTGGATIKNGAIQLDGAANRLATTGTVTLGDTGSTTTGKLILGGSIATSQTLEWLTTVGSGGGVVGGNANTSTLTMNIGTGLTDTFSGILGGAGTDENNLALTKTGTGTFVLSGANTYSGVTTVSGGVLNIQNNGALGTTAGNTSLGTGTTLQIQGGLSNVPENFTVNGGTIENVSGNNTLTGIITKSGVLYLKSTAGKLTLQGNIDGSNNSVYLQGAGDGEISGVISIAFSVTKTDNGTWVLSGPNTYTTATTVSGGTLIYQNTYASNSHTISSGAALEINVASGTRDSATTTFNGTGTLRKTGGGELIWGSAPATFALGSGALIDVASGNFYGGSNANEVWTNNKSDLNVASGATFKTVEANVRLNKITGTGTIGTGFNGAGYANLTIGVDGGSSQFDGVIANTDNNSSYVGNLVKAGSGVITLTGANTYTGVTTLSGGILNVATLSNYGVAGSLGKRASDASTNVGILFRGGTLQYTGSTAQNTDRGIRISTTSGAYIDASGSTPSATMSFLATSSADFFESNGNRQLTLTGSNTGDNTFAMAIGQAGGTTTLTKSGSGKWVLTGINTYTGTTTINDGTLQIGGAGRLGNGTYGGAISLASATATFHYNSSANQTLNGTISGSGALIKSGSGVLTLTGANTYTGMTTINQGTLLVNGTLSASTAVTVSSGVFDIQSFNQTVAGVQLISGGILGSGGSLTSTTTFDIRSGTVSANLAGGVGLDKTLTAAPPSCPATTPTPVRPRSKMVR